MSSTPSLPVLGAALSLAGLRQHRGWLLENQRDLEIQDFFWPDVLDGDWKALAGEIRAELVGYKGRLGVHGPFWNLSIAVLDREIRAVVEKRMSQALDICDLLGATQLVVHSAYSCWDHFNRGNNPGSRQRAIDLAHATLGSAVRRAEAMGLVIVIENTEDIDPYARVDVARSFASASVKVSLDTGHANYAHGVLGGPPVDYFIRAAGETLEHVHLHDTDGYADRHWNPGEGNINWREIFRALAELPTKPRLLLELRDQTTLRRGADHLVGLGLAL